MNEWIYISDIKSLDGINQIHCDTRDFNCLMKKEYISGMRWTYKMSLKEAFTEAKFLMTTDEILTFLKGLETMSGGQARWRHLLFDGIDCKGWLKYIRFFRDPQSPNMWLVCQREVEPFEWRKCTIENLNIQSILNSGLKI